MLDADLISATPDGLPNLIGINTEQIQKPWVYFEYGTQSKTNKKQIYKSQYKASTEE